MRPQKQIAADIKEHVWDKLHQWSLTGEFDQLTNALSLVPAVQSEQLRGYHLKSVSANTTSGSIRVYLIKFRRAYPKGKVEQDTVQIDLYPKYKEEEWE